MGRGPLNEAEKASFNAFALLQEFRVYCSTLDEQFTTPV